MKCRVQMNLTWTVKVKTPMKGLVRARNRAEVSDQRFTLNPRQLTATKPRWGCCNNKYCCAAENIEKRGQDHELLSNIVVRCEAMSILIIGCSHETGDNFKTCLKGWRRGGWGRNVDTAVLVVFDLVSRRMRVLHIYRHFMVRFDHNCPFIIFHLVYSIHSTLVST